MYSYRLQCRFPGFWCSCVREGPFRVSTNQAELFGPESGGFTAAAAALQTPRDGHTATTLPGGAVLFAGGTQHAVTGLHRYPIWCSSSQPLPRQTTTVLSSAELFK